MVNATPQFFETAKPPGQSLKEAALASNFTYNILSITAQFGDESDVSFTAQFLAKKRYFETPEYSTYAFHNSGHIHKMI